jgi:hypothetical protein
MQNAKPRMQNAKPKCHTANSDFAFVFSVLHFAFFFDRQPVSEWDEVMQNAKPRMQDRDAQISDLG